VANVTFLTPGYHRETTVEVPLRGWRTLLSLARQHAVPLRCDCRKGRCGTCAVKVAVLNRDHGPGRVRLGRKEKAVLYKAGKLTRAQYESKSLADTPPLWRLACRYVVRDRDEDILVALS
jgi:uncharacterized 2Fe-2S/4Fe-4S cluster protein (DUF4445 family)